MSTNYISPAMLPLGSIAEYMDKVEGFSKKKEASEDTKAVGNISSEFIAIAARTPQGALVNDRETVKNALQLGGVDATEYVTTAGANALLSDTHKVSINSGNEIKNLRDEVYQLKAELAKAGLIRGNACYNGYYDAFKEGRETYVKKEITLVSTTLSQNQLSYVLVEDVTDFLPGEYVVIETDVPQIAKILDIDGTDRLNFTTGITGPIPQGTRVLKTYGTYNDGMFIFGEKKEIAIATQEKYIVLNDDAQPISLVKKYTPNSGYASQINIPSTARGAIRRVGVQAKVTGNPGGLRCYVIDPLSNVEDVFTMTTIKEMVDKGKVIGQSELLYASRATQSYNELYFEFPEVVALEKQNYIFLFVQTDADSNNYWELKGLRGETNIDLQTNSKLFSFTEGNILKPEDGDLYIVVVTSDIIRNTVNYSKQGLYTARVELSELCPATRIRVELKVNREGRFAVVDNPNTLLPGVNANLNTYNEDNKSYATTLFNVGQKIAIGNQIAEVGNSITNNTSFSLNKTTYAPEGAPVYRIGYKVQAKACKTSIDTGNAANPIKREDKTLIELPLVSIIPGKEPTREGISSDRLIFEAIIKADNSGYILEQFNEIEAQVYWENPGATIVDLNNSPEIAGKILDITISTDNTYNKLKN